MAKYVSPEGLDDALKAVATTINGKVDKVNGKGLSTNDFTTTLKNKLDGIASGAEVNVQSDWNATSGDAFIKNKPTIPSAVTESTVSGWGFTKNTGTYSKPSTGIPYADLASGVQNSLMLADSAIQGHQSIYPLSIKDSAGNTFKTYTPNGGSATIIINKDVVGLSNVSNDAQVKRSEMGVASGVATLDASGLVPTSQLPSYVDDVLEYTAKSNFPTTGTTGKIYVDTSTNKTYRWGGSAYVEISASLALGTTSSTAYRGDLGKQNADNISTLFSFFDSSAVLIAKRTLYSLTVGSKTFDGSEAITITKSDLSLGNVENTKLSTWAGSSKITTLGTITSGTWNGSVIGNSYITNALTGKTYNGYTLAAACAKGVDTTLTPGTTSTNLPTSKAVASALTELGTAFSNALSSYTPTANLTKSLVGLGNVENKSSATIRSEITKANVTSALGTGSGTTKYLREDGSWATPPNTTYSSKTAASGGTDVSLVTTGEKYTWNNKQSAISDLGTIRTNATYGATAYYWGNHADAGYQKASTAITTSNIGSQSVSSANSLTPLGAGDSASKTDVWRKVWMCYSDNTTGRPAIHEVFAFNTDSNTLKIGTGTISPTQYSGNAATATNVAWSGVTGKPTIPSLTVHEFTSTGATEYTVTHNLNSTNVLVLGAYSADAFTTGKFIHMWGGGSYNPSSASTINMQFRMLDANRLMLSFRASSSYVPQSGKIIRVLILKLP